MSYLQKAAKDIGFGRPFNGMPFNDPYLDVAHMEPIELLPAEYGGGVFNSSDGTGLFTTSGGSRKFAYTSNGSATFAYMNCPPLSAIINKKAQAHINGKMFIMDKEGKESTSADAKKIRKLLRKPNPLQSWKQFDAQQKIYIQLFGFCIVLPIIPAGWESRGPIEATSLWNIPPYMVDIKETEKLFYQTDLAGIVSHIKLNYRGQTTDLPVKSLAIFRDIVPSFNTLVVPESRVALLEKPVNTIINAMDSENEVIAYAGSQGIISPDTGSGQYVPVAMEEKEKLQLQADFKRQYGIRSGQFRYIISPAAIKWQSMGTEPAKLMLIEFIAEASVEICNEYGVPPFLMGLRDSTFNNQNTAQKSLYEGAVIPESESIDEEWNNFFRLDIEVIRIEKDFSHLAVLQEDKESMARALNYNTTAASKQFYDNLITYNEYRTSIGQDTIAGMDKLYKDLLAEGWTFGAKQAAPKEEEEEDKDKPKTGAAAA